MKKRQKHKQNKARTSAMDSFTNALARTGFGQPNLINATEYPITRLTRNYQLLTSLYRSSWIVKKIINTIPDDMVKNWFSVSSDIPPEMLDRFAKLERYSKIKEKITEALYWSRLYGGSAAIMLLEGNEDSLDEPLRPDYIMPNTFKGLLVVDRWSGIYPDTELVTNISDPDFGLPKYYQVRDNTNGNVVRIHHSRILRFVNRTLPYWESLSEMQWGASEVEHVYDDLLKRDNTSANIASLVFQANLRVLKIKGLDNGAIALMDEEAQRDLYNVLQSQNALMNNNSMQIIGSDDDFLSLQYTFSGLNDIYESFMLDIAGAAEIPVTRLFGRAPAGLNATGESDLQNYYETVAQLQESKLKPLLNKLLPVMFMSEFGYVPNDLDVKFNPVRTASDKEIAELVEKKTNSIVTAFDAGIIDRRISMKELQQLSYTTNMFTNITDDDIEKANDELIDEELLGGDAFEKEGLATSEKNRSPISEILRKNS